MSRTPNGCSAKPVATASRSAAGRWRTRGSSASSSSGNRRAHLTRLQLLRRQFEYVIELRGEQRAIPFFRKMGHWYLKAMHVPAHLRNAFQQAKSREQLHTVLAEIAAHGPTRTYRDGLLPEMHIPVPSGPVEHW
jgi:tRNA-dihydrouridine synthase